MYSQAIKIVREELKLTQAKVAQRLGVSSRTIALWEGVSGKNLSAADEAFIQQEFLEPLLGPMLARRCRIASQAIPSEIVGIRFVDALRNLSIRLPSAIYIRELSRPPALTEYSEIPLGLKPSQTTYSLRSGQILNLAGEGIQDHPEKRFPTRYNNHCSLGITESLLRVPYLHPTDQGPRPILMLSFENKLKVDEQEIIISDKAVFSSKEVTEAQALVQRFTLQTEEGERRSVLEILEAFNLSKN